MCFKFRFAANENDNPTFIETNSSMAGSLVPDNNPTTTFNVDADTNVVEAHLPHLKTISVDYLDSATTYTTQDIKDFLAKPYETQSGSLSTTDIPSTFAQIEVLDVMVNTDPYQSKLKGFLGIRADMIVRLVVNASRFQQGRYILFWVPFGGEGVAYSNATTVGINMRLATKTQVTQLPHVELDLSSDTEAVLTIPYTSVLSHYPLNAAASYSGGSLGFFGLYPYSPLVAGSGSSTCAYSIYTSLTNVDLAAPTFPQMAISRKAKSSGKKPPQEEEQSSKGVGPVQSIATTVGNISSSIGEFIPDLAWIAEPVSWAADIVSGIASVFGWSNPIDLSPVTRALQTIYPYSNNPDIVEAGMPLSLYAQNHVEIVPGFATKSIDELSIDYIKTIPAWIASAQFNTTTTAGTAIYSVSVGPSSMNSTTTVASTTVYHYAPVGYLSKFFNLWRGSFRFIFKFVKTEFHSARLEVCFTPGYGYDTPVGGPTTVNQRAYVHREIIDLRQGNTFEMVVPYTSLIPYRANTSSPEGFTGNLSVFILNPLVAPSSVSSTVTMLVEVAGGPDYEVAVPANHKMSVLSGVIPQMSFVPHKDDHAIAQNKIGKSDVRHDNHFAARSCIGEKIVSLLSLLKSADFNFVISSASSYVLDPFACCIAWYNGTGIVASSGSDNITLISSMFLFNRGGVRIKLPTQSPISNTMEVLYVQNSTLMPSNPQYNGPTTGGGGIFHGNAMIQNLAFRGGVDAQIPQYLQVHSRLTSAEWYCINSSGPSVFYGGMYSSLNQTVVSTDSPYSYKYYRQASDDYQCGFFIGVPPIVLAE
jgi:hypothetical protein